MLQTKSRWRLARRLSTVYAGTRILEPGWTTSPARRWSLQAGGPAGGTPAARGIFPLDVGGDPLGDVPVTAAWRTRRCACALPSLPADGASRGGGARACALAGPGVGRRRVCPTASSPDRRRRPIRSRALIQSPSPLSLAPPPEGRPALVLDPGDPARPPVPHAGGARPARPRAARARCLRADARRAAPHAAAEGALHLALRDAGRAAAGAAALLRIARLLPQPGQQAGRAGRCVRVTGGDARHAHGSGRHRGQGGDLTPAADPSAASRPVPPAVTAPVTAAARAAGPAGCRGGPRGGRGSPRGGHGGRGRGPSPAGTAIQAASAAASVAPSSAWPAARPGAGAGRGRRARAPEVDGAAAVGADPGVLEQRGRHGLAAPDAGGERLLALSRRPRSAPAPARKVRRKPARARESSTSAEPVVDRAPRPSPLRSGRARRAAPAPAAIVWELARVASTRRASSARSWSSTAAAVRPRPRPPR